MCDSFFQDYLNSSLTNKNKSNMKLLQQLAMLWSEMCQMEKLFILKRHHVTRELFYRINISLWHKLLFFCSLKKTMKLNVVKNKLIPSISIAFKIPCYCAPLCTFWCLKNFLKTFHLIIWQRPLCYWKRLKG